MNGCSDGVGDGKIPPRFGGLRGKLKLGILRVQKNEHAAKNPPACNQLQAMSSLICILRANRAKLDHFRLAKAS